MTQTYSKSRQRAEIAFGATQTQILAKADAVDEQTSLAKSREDKTARLRQARLERDRIDSQKPAATPSKRVRTP
ncbi:hypothetical protein [Neorhizobium galegae]|uniref:hypothetical protein n=1 Tax=Neorhizobium galegae TaxID=399 RepID=UPI001AE72930|nr:hypothetical protein [Neorhizobium galegae]